MPESDGDERMIERDVLEDYLKKVRHEMRRMDPAIVDVIVAELRDTIIQRGTIEETPEEVASGFIEIYGFGRHYLVRYYALAAILALLSVPISSSRPGIALGALLFYFILAVFLVWFGALAGKKAGLTAGTLALIMRILPVPLLIAVGYNITAGGSLFLITSSVVLPLLGWLPGETKERRGSDGGKAESF